MPSFPNVDLSALGNSLLMFLPELVVTAAIVLLLLLRMVARLDRAHLGGVALAMTIVALFVSGYIWYDLPDANTPLFTGLVVMDNLTNFMRVLLLAATGLTILLTFQTGIPDAEDSADFHVLLLGGTLGMMLMASANHLLMAYIAIEMASLPSYALAGFLKGKRQGSEAALKYVVYGGGASGVMLYGISLLAGKFGTAYLPDLSTGYALALQAQFATGGVDAILVMGTLLILVGLGFKLSAVPFHFWCPDVFEGAAAEVAAFLSVASKAAAFALTGRLLLTLADAPGMEPWTFARYFGPPLAVLAAVTATFGNLAAYAQDNLKRLLAYSTIAHAGYMLMGLAVLTAEGAGAVLFYLATYVFMNLGAFAVVAFVRNRTGSEDISAYRGLAYRSPALAVLMGIFLLSLLGIPPLAGFLAKFEVFLAIFHAGRDASDKVPWLGQVFYALLVIGGINTVFSAVYYIRVLKVMALDRPADEAAAAPLRVPSGAGAYAGFLALVVVALLLVWNPLTVASDRGVSRYAPDPPTIPRALLQGAGGQPKAVGGNANRGGQGEAAEKADRKAKAPREES
jgi:NADH-quinone oxidoreductase subunit N